MKRLVVAIATAGFVLTGASVAFAGTVGPPEIDRAAANIQVGSSPFKAVACLGEDGIRYVTYRGNWAGGESDASPAPGTDYSLTGKWVVRNIVWTINLSTQRGLFEGTATLVGTTASGSTQIVYSGPITLVTQGLPKSSTAPVQARGAILANTYTSGKTDGGSLVANVEFTIGGGFSANGEFGATMNFTDLSVVTNNMVC